ncbi:MAG: hypothetical protein PF689_08950 [Deltaproteobacteria bacterium]|jgi:hypoxanthine phosphoribosyltransferase|nr:hypothetical protein [Deltaproteobacteria bacterium]
MPDILHISPSEFLLKSFKLGRKLYQQGFRPKHTISVWRGGTPVGLGVDAYYRCHGFFMNHTTIATESYSGIGQRGSVNVKGLEHVINVVCREDDLLIIDDVYESGNTIQAIVETIRKKAKANAPRKIVVGTLHSKPVKHQYKELEIISVEQIAGDVWIDYPHELADLATPEDPQDCLIRAKDQTTWDLLHNDLPTPPKLLNTGKFNYLNPAQLHYDSLKLGLNIARENKYVPDFLIALWPGGISAGLPIHEVYKYLHKKGEVDSVPDHISLNTTKTHLTYRSNIIGMEYLVNSIEKHNTILIVEVAFKSGRLISDVITKLKEKLRRNLTLDNIKIATVYYNPSDDSTWTVKPFKKAPDFFWSKVDHTMVYPNNLYRLKNILQMLPEISPELYEILYK